MKTMKILIVKFLSILMLLAFEAWFLWPKNSSWNFEWEPLIGMLASLIAYIGIETKAHYSQTAPDNGKTPKVSQADVELFQELSKLFPSGTAAFFRDHDFNHSFPPDPMYNLFDYIDNWTTVEHEFLNPELQQAHSVFREKAAALSNAFTTYTTTNQNGRGTVAPSGHQGGPLPKWAKEEAEKLNLLANEFYKSHQSFNSQARLLIHQGGVL